MTKYALVGDVGGTNARLALCDSPVEKSRRPKRIPAWIIPVLRPWCAFISMSIASAWKMVVSP